MNRHTTRLLLAAILLGLPASLGACNTSGTRFVAQDDMDARTVEARKLWAKADSLRQNAEHEKDQVERAQAYQKAAEMYRKSLQQREDIGAVWQNLGVCLMEGERNYMDAGTAFRRAAELLPTDPRPYENLAQAYLRAGWHKESLQYFVESLDRDPAYLPSLRGHAVLVQTLMVSDEPSLERLQRALLLETDPAWRAVIQRQVFRVERDLADKPSYASPS
ncbi:MAG: tetratricopeptide repeat protein [Phycisphaerales bacterium]